MDLGALSASPTRSPWSVGLASVLDRAARRRQRPGGGDDGGLQDDDDLDDHAVLAGSSSAFGDQEQELWDAAFDSVLEDSLDADKALEQEQARVAAVETQLQEAQNALADLREAVHARDQALEDARKQLLAEKLRCREAESRLVEADGEIAHLRADLDEAHARVDELVRTQPREHPGPQNPWRQAPDARPEQALVEILAQDREETKSEYSASHWPYLVPAQAVVEPSPALVEAVPMAESPLPDPLAHQLEPPLNLTRSPALSAPDLESSSMADDVEPRRSFLAPPSEPMERAAETELRILALSISADPPARNASRVLQIENSVSSFELLQQLREGPRRRRRPRTSPTAHGETTQDVNTADRSGRELGRRFSHADVSDPAGKSCRKHHQDERHVEHAWEQELDAERRFQRRLLLGKDPADRRLLSAWDDLCTPFRERLAVISQLDGLGADARPLYAAEQLERIRRWAKGLPDATRLHRVARQLEAVVARERELAPDRAPPHADPAERERAALVLSRDRRRMERHVRVLVRNWQRENRRVFYFRGIPFLDLLDARHAKTCRDADRDRRHARLRRIPYQAPAN